MGRHFPVHDDAASDSLVVLLAYVAAGSPHFWSDSGTKGPKGCKCNAIPPLASVQQKFGYEFGDLAALVGVYKAWEKTPKRERPRWCRRNHVVSGNMSEIEEFVVKMKLEKEKTTRRRSIRIAEIDAMNEDSSNEHSTAMPAEEANIVPGWTALVTTLLRSFPTCLYCQVLPSGVYINVTANTVKCLDEECSSVFAALEVIHLPRYILTLPSVGADRDSAMVWVSIACPSDVVHRLSPTIPPIVKNQEKIKLLMPVTVRMPSIGDAVAMKLTGTSEAREELKKSIVRRCVCHPELVVVRMKDHASSKLGRQVEILCPAGRLEAVSAYIRQKVTLISRELESVTDFVHFPDPSSGVTILCGSGGRVLEIDSANRGHVVLVYVTSAVEQSEELAAKWTDKSIVEHFSQYGNVLEVHKSRDFPQNSFWGTIQFDHFSTVIRATEAESKAISESTFMLVYAKGNKPLYHMNIYWRRPIVKKNRMHVHLRTAEDYKKILKYRWRSQLQVEFIEEERKVIISADDATKNLIDTENMIVERIRVFPKFVYYDNHIIYDANEEDMERLKAEFQRRLGEMPFDADTIMFTIDKPPVGASYIHGTLTSYSFPALLRVEDILPIGRYDGQIEAGELFMDHGAILSFTMKKAVYNCIEGELQRVVRHNHSMPRHGESDDEEEQVEDNMDDFNLTISTKKLEEDDQVKVDIFRRYYGGTTEDDIVKMTRLLEPYIISLTGRDITTLTVNNCRDMFFISKTTNTVIDLNMRQGQARIYGTGENVKKATDMIMKLSKSACELPKPGKSRRSTPQKLLAGKSRRSTPQKLSVLRKVKVYSTDTGFSEELAANVDEEVCCSVCFCTVEYDCYRLSLCGHAYCMACLKQQVTVSINIRKIPIQCAHDGCPYHILNCDLQRVCTISSLSIHNLHHSALQSFLQVSMGRVRPCITPDCAMVYYVCTDSVEGKGRAFSCPLCQINLCTFCHGLFHDGLTCSVVKAMDTVDKKVRIWMNEDRETRKLCPNCLTGIEKDGGCDHVTCTSCKAEICWLCLQFFLDAQKLSYHNCVGDFIW